MREDKQFSLLFDLQKFFTNKHLQSEVNRVGVKYGLIEGCLELSDDEVEVWAAGDLSLFLHSDDNEDQDGK